MKKRTLKVCVGDVLTETRIGIERPSGRRWYPDPPMGFAWPLFGLVQAGGPFSVFLDGIGYLAHDAADCRNVFRVSSGPLAGATVTT